MTEITSHRSLEYENAGIFLTETGRYFVLNYLEYNTFFCAVKEIRKKLFILLETIDGSRSFPQSRLSARRIGEKLKGELFFSQNCFEHPLCMSVYNQGVAEKLR